MRIVVRSAPGDTIRAVTGTLAGEPLHFTRDSSGSLAALGAIPIDAANSLPLVVWLERPGTPADSLVRQIAIARGQYKLEKLTVAPQFGSKPDSALEARLASEAAQASAVGRQSHETTQLWRGAFLRPRPGRVTSTFGTGREFNGTVQSRHMGTDFAGTIGAPVRAANRGVVALIGCFYLGGNVVYVDHGAGLTTAYLHLSHTDVAVGDTVTRGQLIGRVGRTGRVTGPHLHWIARYGGVTVDPLSLLAATGSASGASGGSSARRAPRVAKPRTPSRVRPAKKMN